MYRGYDNECGLPPRIYRAPEEIGRDMRRLKAAISEINSKLNIRSLLLDIISEEAETSPEGVVLTLENMLAEAEEALSRLRELRFELSLLEEELHEVRCEMRT